MNIWRVCLGMVAAGVAAGAAAMATASLSSQPISTQRVVTLPEQVDLNALVLLTADALDLTIEFDPNLLKAAGSGSAMVYFRGARELTPEELWEFTTQVLSARGVVLARPPGAKVLSLVRVEAAAAVAGVRMEGDRGERSGFVTELMRLKSRSGKEIAEMTSKLGLKAPSAVTPLGDSDLLIISDYATRIDDVKRLIDQFDTPRGLLPLVTITARNLPAAALLAGVTALAAKRDAVEGSRLKGEVALAPDGRSLIVIAPDDARPRWLELIALLDQREAVTTVEYATRAFTPKEVADLLAETLQEPRLELSGPGTPPAATSNQLKLVVNDLTGTLIVTTTATQHERVRVLIERLESSTAPASARPLRMFPVRNRPADEVMATLASVVHRAGLQGADIEKEVRRAAQQSEPERSPESPLQRSPSSGSLVPRTVPTPTAGQPAEASGRYFDKASSSRVESRTLSGGTVQSDVYINVDRGTNSIIAMAEPRMLAQIQHLIELIDRRQPQVLLEITLVSLSEQDAMNVGIELEKVGVVDGASYQVSSLFGGSGGTAGRRTPSDARGLTSAVLNPGDFSVVLRALQTISRGSTRSVPSVLVSNNEAATFNSVLQQPYVVSNTTSGAGTTTSFGGTQDAGTTITVTPQMAQADQLLLQYSLALSSFVGAPPSNGLPPARQQNTVSSKATIPDGFTVVVGGIELQSEGKNTSQIPGIGDVPVVGELFKSRDNSTGRSRFYVFIRATVLRDQQLNDLKFLSVRAGRAAGVSDGFPEMKPRIVK